jgi:hypothetical protein
LVYWCVVYFQQPKTNFTLPHYLHGYHIAEVHGM